MTVGLYASVANDAADADAIRQHGGTLADLFRVGSFDRPWTERHLVRTDDLTSRHDDLFRALVGGNFGVRREFFERAGGFDESFVRYGGEDTELAYRLYLRGGVFVPVREAWAWHLGRWADGRRERVRWLRAQRPKLEDLIAHPAYRAPRPGRIYAVPMHVVTVEANEQTLAFVQTAVERLLAGAEHDLVVRFEPPAGADGEALLRLREAVGSDPRVHMAGAHALDVFAAAPFHVNVEATTPFGPDLIARLRNALGESAVATLVFGDGSTATIARAWALQRARAVGLPPSTFGDAVTKHLPPAPPPRRRIASFWPARTPVGGVGRVFLEARHVRGPRTGWRFLRWLVMGVRRRLARTPGTPPGAIPGDVPLGARILLAGERARAVFPASSDAIREPTADVDVVLGDTASDAKGIDAPVVALAGSPGRLAVPAFDMRDWNPVGWVRNVESRAVALGPRALLPVSSDVRSEVASDDRNALRHCHHVEDVAAFHTGLAARAGTLAKLAAMGVPVHLADGGEGLAELLGKELHAAMTADVRELDANERELLSIRARRAALRDHAAEARARQVCQAVLAEPPRLPRVSVLLATCRPACLPHALASVARQTYPRLELVLALHGSGFP